MKKLYLFSVCAVASTGFIAQAQAQEYLPGKLHPVETVCKTEWDSIESYIGRVVIGETYHFSCGDNGSGLKNAWKMKVLEDGDTVCKATHPSALAGSYNSAFTLQVFEVREEKFDAQCPWYSNSQYYPKRLLTNAVTLYRKTPDPLFQTGDPLNAPLNGYARVAYDTGTNIATYRVPGTETIMCTSSSTPAGYTPINPPFYHAACYPGTGTTHGQYIKIPGATENNVYHFISSGNTSYAFQNYIKTEVVKTASNMSNIKRASDTVEYACINGNNYTALGYRGIGKIFTVACSPNQTPDSTEMATPNTEVMKKLGDDIETICKLRPSTSYEAPVPNGYTLVSEVQSATCPRPSASSTAPNALQLRRLADTDVICKTNKTPAGYGVIAETAYAGCAATGNNAWRIKKLGASETICKEPSWGVYGYFSPRSVFNDYVADGETNVPACPGTGNNAWTIRLPNEPTDTVCVPSALVKGYVKDGAGFRGNCPSATSYNIRLDQ